MRCIRCSAESPTGAVACARCGEVLVLLCRRCGRACTPESNFCSQCGHTLGGAGEETVAAPRSYTPKHLADKILTSRAALEGERKQVTVLFVDVKGSMDLARQVDPEEWHRVLDGFFAILAAGVHRWEGTINQYTGDGVMALFGAPLAHEDHAQRACHAALELRDGLRRYAAELRRTREITFAARMGLNSGEVIVGRIGDDLRMDYTAQGHTVGLAARMEQAAGPGRICLTSHTAALVSDFFELKDLGRMRLKGVPKPMGVFALLGPGAHRTRLEAARARGFSRFVGRGAEMAELQAALERAVAGHGQVVGVCASAGAGKSRLCEEFVHTCRAQGLAVAEAHCPPHARALPYLAVRDLLRSFFGIDDGDPRRARTRVTTRLRKLGSAFKDDHAFLLDFLGIPQRQTPPALDEEARRQRLFVLARRLVQTQSGAAPIVLLLDDVHWVDADSDAVLAQLVEAVGWTRTLLLLNFRPGYHADWMGVSYYEPLDLPPLPPAASDELLASLIGDDPSVAHLHPMIRDRAGGNPFFLEEIVRSLLQQGVVERTASGEVSAGDESPTLKGDFGGIGIPPTVQSLVAARIDRLSEEEKQVLLTAAVIGKKFEEPLLRLVLDDLAVAEAADATTVVPTSRRLEAALEALWRAELIDRKVAPLEYTFVHPLTQEVAYQTQLQDQRRRIHEAVARGMEVVYADRLGEQASLIAHHWSAAERRGAAAAWRYRATLRVTNIQLARPRKAKDKGPTEG